MVKFSPLVVKILYYKFIALITKSTFKISWKSAHGVTHLSTSDSWNRLKPLLINQQKNIYGCYHVTLYLSLRIMSNSVAVNPFTASYKMEHCRKSLFWCFLWS